MAKLLENRMGPPLPTHHIACRYRTPSGGISYAFQHIRQLKESEAVMIAKINTCANPRRKVVRGVDGIECRIYGIST